MDSYGDEMLADPARDDLVALQLILDDLATRLLIERFAVVAHDCRRRLRYDDTVKCYAPSVDDHRLAYRLDTTTLWRRYLGCGVACVLRARRGHLQARNDA